MRPVWRPAERPLGRAVAQQDQAGRAWGRTTSTAAPGAQFRSRPPVGGPERTAGVQTDPGGAPWADRRGANNPPGMIRRGVLGCTRQVHPGAVWVRMDDERENSVWSEDEERGEHVGHVGLDAARPRPVPHARPRAAGRAGQAGHGRRRGRPQADGGRQPAARRPLGPPLPGPRRGHGRPGPGGHVRPHAGGREVRLGARLPLLDLRHLVDPPGPPARRPAARAHHPHPARGRRADPAPRAGQERAGQHTGPPAHRARSSTRPPD